MKPLSLEPVFLPATTDIAPMRSRLKRNRNIGETLKMLREAEFDAAYDMLRAISAEAVAAGEAERASSTLAGLDQVLTGDEEAQTDGNSGGDEIHAAVLQILTALLIEEGKSEEAALTAARALNLLATDPKRKDAPFLQVLGALLYDIAYLHSERGEYKQAEREVEKAIKIFERLAKSKPDRYAPAHVMALNNATATYRNRVKQAEILAHYQAATSAYLHMLNAGVEDAAGRLVESLTAEGGYPGADGTSPRGYTVLFACAEVSDPHRAGVFAEDAEAFDLARGVDAVGQRYARQGCASAQYHAS